MNAALVGGCAAAGAATGVVMDMLAARVPIPATAPSGAPPDDDGDAPVSTVPPRPLPVELIGAAALTAALFGVAALRLGAMPELAPFCVLFAGLVAVSVSDIRVGLVPRVFLYPTVGLVAVGLVAASAVKGDWHASLDAAIGGAAAFAVFFAIWWLVPRSMGFGDVRLAGVIGLSLGWLGLRQVYLAFVLAFVIGSIVGLAKMAVQRTGRKTALPFGPALAAGAVIGVLWGGTLANLWFHP
ncbi:MAG: prepilin peptidase [Acidimicrobiales bacterium]